MRALLHALCFLFQEERIDSPITRTGPMIGAAAAGATTARPMKGSLFREQVLDIFRQFG